MFHNKAATGNIFKKYKRYFMSGALGCKINSKQPRSVDLAMVRKKRFYSLISVFKGLKIITEQPT
jgi:hypothetical protein